MTPTETSPVPLAEFLRRHKPEIFPRWQKALSECAPAARLPEAAPADHLPVVLDQIADAAEHIARGDWAGVPSDAVVTHAMRRLCAGFDVREVVTEFFLLRHTLLDCVMGGDRSAIDSPGNVQLLCWAVDAMIRECVAAFAAAKQETLEALERVSSEALACRTLDELFPRLLQVLAGFSAGVDVACLLLVEGDRLVHRAAVGIDAHRHETVSLAIGEGVVGKVAAEGTSRAWTSTDQDESPEGAFLRDHGIRTVLTLPLAANDRIMGVVQIGSTSLGEFTEAQTVLLRAFADRVGSAVDQHQLRERAEHLAQERDRLAEQKQLALDAACLGWWHYDPVAHAFEHDQRLANVFGIEGAQLSVDEKLRLLHPDDLPGFSAAFQAALDPDHPTPFAAEYRITRPDGTVRWIEAHGLATFEGEGPNRRATGAAGTIADVTERKRFTEHLRKALEEAELERSRLTAVLNALPAGVAIADASGKITMFNAALTRIRGTPPTPSRLGDVPWRARRADTGEPLATQDSAMARALGTGRAVSGDIIEVEKSDGTGFCTVVSAAAPIRDREGNMVGGVLAELDITAQRQAEKALRQSEARLRVLFENMPDAVFLTVTDGRIVAANPAACAMFGRTEEEMVRAGLDVLMDKDDARHTAFREALARTGRVANEELSYVRKNGERITGETSSAVIQGGPQSAFVMVHDVSARRLAEEDVRRANADLADSDRRKNEFLGTLSHELRNPLAPIRNSLYILERAAPGSEQARRAYAVIDRQINQLTRLVDDLLDVTRVARGKIRLIRTRIDLVEVVQRALDDQRTLLADYDLEVALPDKPVWVDGDATRIAQILGNLLQNAAKFTPKEGKITVSLSAIEGKAILEIADTGIGIDADTLKTIFEPYAQAERSLARSRGGLGLGLALVKGLVELHDGKVAADSAGPGRGAQFTITLPVASRVDAPTEPTVRPRPGDKRGRRILVVEDNRDSADSLSEALTLLGHRVIVAYDAETALAKAREFHPEAVICDIGLPDMTGYALAAALRSESSASAALLIALTGFAQPEDERCAFEAGFNAHLAKPPDLAALEHLLADSR